MTKPWPEIRHKSDTAYVGGPMTNLPNFNFAAFDSLSAFLRDVQGWKVHNPHEHDQQMYPGIDAAEATAVGDVVGIAAEVGFSFKDAMSWDLARVAESQHMVLLPGWESSTGAKAERFVAEMTGSQIWLANKSEHRPLGDPAWYITLDPEQKRLTPPSLPGVDLGYASAGKKPLKLYDGPLVEPEAEIRNGQGIEQFARDGERREAWAQDIEHVRQGSPFTMPHADPLGIQSASSTYKMVDPYGLKNQRHEFLLPSIQLGAAAQAQIGQFQTKDSGARVEFESGMVRDVQDDKPRYDLIPLAPLQRLAELYSRGAQKYGDRNWQKANSQDELDRFHASAFRHFIQFLKGDRDEDHGIGCVWNIFAALWLEEKLARQADECL